MAKSSSGKAKGAGKLAPSGQGVLQELLAKAMAEQDAILKADPERSWTDPTLPVFRLHAAVMLHRHEKRFLAGNCYAMMEAIRLCANHDLVMPRWLAEAYITKFDSVNNYRAKSWDEVFGAPLPKGKHLAAMRKKRQLQPKVYFEIKELLNEGYSVDDAARIAGEKNALGRTLAWEYYTSYGELMGNSEQRADRAVALITNPENFKTLRSDETEE